MSDFLDFLDVLDTKLDVLDTKPVHMMSDDEWAEFERGMRNLFASIQNEQEAAYLMGLSLRDAVLFVTDIEGSA
jgi:hypothetical protein